MFTKTLLALFSVILLGVASKAYALSTTEYTQIAGVFCITEESTYTFLSMYEAMTTDALGMLQAGMIPGCGIGPANFKAESKFYEKHFTNPNNHTVKGFTGEVETFEGPVWHLCAVEDGESDRHCSIGEKT